MIEVKRTVEVEIYAEYDGDGNNYEVEWEFEYVEVLVDGVSFWRGTEAMGNMECDKAVGVDVSLVGIRLTDLDTTKDALWTLAAPLARQITGTTQVSFSREIISSQPQSVSKNATIYTKDSLDLGSDWYVVFDGVSRCILADAYLVAIRPYGAEVLGTTRITRQNSK